MRHKLPFDSYSVLITIELPSTLLCSTLDLQFTLKDKHGMTRCVSKAFTMLRDQS